MESIQKYKLPSIERQRVNKDFLLKTLNRNICFEVAVEEDRQVIVDFFLNEYITNEPLSVSFKIQKSEGLLTYLNRILDNALSRKVTILAVDDGCLCGVFICHISKAIHITEWKEPKMKDDYGEEFDANQIPVGDPRGILVVLESIEKFFSQNLPAHVEEYLILDMLSVHKDYTKNGLAKKLIAESCKQGHQQDINWAQIICTAVATNKIVQTMSFIPIFSLDIKRFRAHGQRILPDNFIDGGQQITSYSVDLQKLVTQFEE